MLKLNVEVYPKYYKAYDDIGDAYLKSKQYQISLENYNHSIELYPDNSATKRKIEKVKKLLEK